MKLKFTLIKLAFFFLFAAFSVAAFAQAQSLPGPSDATTAPPTSAGSVAKVLCATNTISLKSGQTVNPNYTYQWFKTNTSGTRILVKETVGNDTYTETPSGDGYYTYQLVVLNGNGCPSPASNDIKLYVLPPLNPTIAGAGVVCEQNKTSTDLTITGLDSRFTYTYQWTRNNTAITAANGGTANHYVVKESASGTVTYGVTVNYVLNNSCSGSATKTITVDTLPAQPTIVVN
ncbi:hypothetical protein [Mucilaginibacter lacusdianchii]|uniref:hypothetical protein n=1 Tax=Mucilaginibacter lacusdianchii TaxID=2684211 RepID=UPI00131CFDF2|nr:hypothetical protein [Mucilaginibacter sp. JXJ CY 39]